MDRSLKLLLLVTLGPLLLGADPIELDLASPPCEWQKVFDALATDSPVKSQFEELRSNPFHKRPRRFKGEIFWYPEYGLSLQYTTPSRLKINISSKEVILHRSGEAPRQLDMAEDNPALSMFFKLFDWDIDWLGENFSFAGEMEGSNWKLRLRPVDDLTRKKLSRIDLEGTGNVLESINLDLAGGKEVRIKLSAQKINWDPAQDFLKSQFGILNVGD